MIDLSKVKASLDRIQGRNIMIVGDVGLDQYVIGSVRRISPEAPVPVLEVQSEETRLGLASNVAQNISGLGGTPMLIGVVGEDAHAKDLKADLQKAKVSDRYLVSDPHRPTTHKMRIMAQQHHIVRVDYEKRQFLSSEIEDKVLARVKDHIGDCDGVILQDYAKGVLTERVIREVVTMARGAKKRVLLDPNSNTPTSFYKGVDIMTPNLSEAMALAGVSQDDLRGVSETLVELGAKLREIMGSQQVVITRGKDGMSLFEGSVSEKIPTFARQVFDVTGAGDTVIATLAMAWTSGLSLKESCQLSNFAAGVVVGKIGCVPCTTQELREFIDSFDGAKFPG